MKRNDAVPADREQKRPPGRPAVVSRALVQRTALQIVDDEGLERLTMRRLGAVLAVDPMSAYRHFPSKADLFDAVVEQILAEAVVPSATGAWWTDFAALVHALRAACLAHPNAVPLLATRPPTTPAGFVLIEAAVSVLLQAGFRPQDAIDSVDCAARLVIGHVLAESGPTPVGLPGGEVEHQHAERDLGAAEFPALAEVTQAGVAHDPDRLFALALEGLYLSISARRDAGVTGLQSAAERPLRGYVAGDETTESAAIAAASGNRPARKKQSR